jgi:2-oxoglutarate ferredoxin oxidoreductase subunit beta
MLENLTVTAVPAKQYGYKGAEKPTWCPGCGDFGVLNAVYAAMRQNGYNPKDVVCVSGIGCSSRLPFFVTSYGFHGLHGRAMPIATGIKAANPELTVIAFGGDGDAFAIGGDHFMHACRRNLDITYVVMDNGTYGLTKGQTSPTSRAGYVTKTTPQGSPDHPVNPLALAMICGATYVAQGFSSRPKEVSELIIQGIAHKGFSFIEVLSPCPTFNKVDTIAYFKETVQSIPAGHDSSDIGQALSLAMTREPILSGVFYQLQRDTFGTQYRRQLANGVQTREQALGRLFARFS